MGSCKKTKQTCGTLACHGLVCLASEHMCLPWLCYREIVGGVNVLKWDEIIANICIISLNLVSSAVRSARGQSCCQPTE